MHPSEIEDIFSESPVVIPPSIRPKSRFLTPPSARSVYTKGKNSRQNVSYYDEDQFNEIFDFETGKAPTKRRKKKTSSTSEVSSRTRSRSVTCCGDKGSGDLIQCKICNNYVHETCLDPMELLFVEKENFTCQNCEK